MQNIISRALLTRHMDLSFYGPFMSPYFAVHVKYAGRTDGPWVWTSERAVEECLASTWDMLGKWQARRAVKVDRSDFDAGVPGAVARLARVLSRHKVRSLRDVGAPLSPKYRNVMRAIQDAVMTVSGIKTTAGEPMFGAKVLHHYFPSVVPVFDTAKVRNCAMRTRAFGEFIEELGDDWLVMRDAEDAGGGVGLEFHRYAAFCAAQVKQASAPVRRGACKALAEAVADFAPRRLIEDKMSFLWRLDAKVAEFCALAQAAQEGYK